MFKNINKFIYGLSLLATFIMMILLVLLDVVPTKYLMIIVIMLGIIYIVLGIITFKTKNKILLVLSCIFSVLFGGISVFASNTISETNSFLTNIGTVKEEGLYHVVVLKKSTYKNLSDLNSKKIATYSLNDEHYSKVVGAIKEKIEFKEESYDNFVNIATDLLENKVDAILVSDFNKEMLDDEIEGFSKGTKIIHTEKVKIEPEIVAPNDIAVNQETFNILISGIDTRGSISKVSRSDVNIVVTVNPTKNEILLTSIPRDYYVRLHGTSGNKDKLTHAGIYGIHMSVNTIADLLNTNIDYYLRVNFDTLINVVDKIGGIDVYSDVSFTAYNGDIFVAGMNHLDGSRALSYSRERKQFAEGDRKRGKHQEEVITAIIKKVSSSKVLLANYSAILESLQDTFQTSMPTDTIKSFVKGQLDEMINWNVKSISLDGVGRNDYTYSMPGRLLYVMVPDEQSVARASALIEGMKQNRSFQELGFN